MLPALQPTLVSVCVFGVAAALLGAAGLLARGPARAWLVGALALGLAGGGAAAALAGLEQFYWLPPLALAALGGLSLLLRWPGWRRLAGSAAAVLALPRVQCAALLLAGPALVLWQARQTEAEQMANELT